MVLHWLKEDFRLCAIEIFNQNGTCVLRKGKFGNSNQTSTELNDGERIVGVCAYLKPLGHKNIQKICFDF